MIVDNELYRRNSKTGNICVRQIVSIKCDRCGRVHDTKFGSYLKTNRKTNNDLCMSCRNSLHINGHKKGQVVREKIERKCSVCGVTFGCYLSEAKEYCGLICSRKGRIRKRYCNLLTNPDINKVSLLVGLILGDGTITDNEMSFMKRVTIYTDSRDVKQIDTIKSTLRDLNVSFSLGLNRKTCTYISFSLPNEFLDICGINFCGDKYKNQPNPKDEIIFNINYALGLILSDGYCHQRKKDDGRYIVFCNSVKSISESLEKCLRKNSIGYKSRIEKVSRYGLKNKDRHITWILKSDIPKFIGLIGRDLEFSLVK